MSQKIPLTIYKIPITQVNAFNKQFATASPSNYLQGVYDVNIEYDYASDDNSDLIPLVFITDSNFAPSENLLNTAGWYAVYDENTNPYVKVRGTKYYLQKQSSTAPSSATDIINNIKGYNFYVNPDRVTPNYRKLQSEIRTLGGWEIQHWGNQLIELTVEGKTGGMHTLTENGQKRVLNLQQGETILDSDAWKKLVELRNLYETDHDRRNKQPVFILGLTYLDGIYLGYFTEFSGPNADAEKPYLMTFRFSFKVQEVIYSSGKVSIPGDK